MLSLKPRALGWLYVYHPSRRRFRFSKMNIWGNRGSRRQHGGTAAHSKRSAQFSNAASHGGYANSIYRVPRSVVRRPWGVLMDTRHNPRCRPNSQTRPYGLLTSSSSECAIWHGATAPTPRECDPRSRAAARRSAMPALSACCLGVLCTLFLTQTASALTSTAFKTLLSQPPREGKTIVEFAGAHQLADTNGLIAATTEFDIRWSGNNVVIGQALPAHPLDRGPAVGNILVQGDYHDHSWQYSADRLTLYDNDARLFDNSIGGRFIFYTLLHLGVQTLVPNSVVWNGDAFKARIALSNQELEIKGNLILDPAAQQVVGLNYSWVITNTSYHIQYAYNSASAEFPEQIVVYGFGQIGNHPLMVFRINEWDTKARLAASDFNPEYSFQRRERSISQRQR